MYFLEMGHIGRESDMSALVMDSQDTISNIVMATVATTQMPIHEVGLEKSKSIAFSNQKYLFVSMHSCLLG